MTTETNENLALDMVEVTVKNRRSNHNFVEKKKKPFCVFSTVHVQTPCFTMFLPDHVYFLTQVP